MRSALILVIATCGWAQPRVEIHQVSGRASERLQEVVRRWRVAQQRSWRDAKAPEEQSVVAAVTKTYDQHFQPDLRSPPRIATLTEKGQDILVARWAVSGRPGSFSELIVWDTPTDTSFIFRLPRASWSGDPSIRSSFERLLLSPRLDGETPPAAGVTLNVARDPSTQKWIGAGGCSLTTRPPNSQVYS